MLGVFTAKGRGEADRILTEIANDLRQSGRQIAGVVQHNVEQTPGARCDMVLEILSSGDMVCISQRLGPGSKGCRLDPIGLEQAVGLVEASLNEGCDLLIVNKFGKQEVDGRGFRPIIGRALSDGVPVLIAVSEGHREVFQIFASEMAEQLPPDAVDLLEWCNNAIESS